MADGIPHSGSQSRIRHVHTAKLGSNEPRNTSNVLHGKCYASPGYAPPALAHPYPWVPAAGRESALHARTIHSLRCGQRSPAQRRAARLSSACHVKAVFMGESLAISVNHFSHTHRGELGSQQCQSKVFGASAQWVCTRSLVCEPRGVAAADRHVSACMQACVHAALLLLRHTTMHAQFTSCLALQEN